MDSKTMKVSVIGLTAILKLDIAVCLLWLSLPVFSGLLKRIDYRNRFVWPTLFLLNVSTALKGTHY